LSWSPLFRSWGGEECSLRLLLLGHVRGDRERRLIFARDPKLRIKLLIEVNRVGKLKDAENVFTPKINLVPENFDVLHDILKISLMLVAFSRLLRLL
jgi:hypothetical protein